MYGENFNRGNYGGYNPYGNYGFDYRQHFFNKNNEKKKIKTIGSAAGFSTLGYLAISLIFSIVLRQISGFKALYSENTAFSIAVNGIFYITVLFIPFFIGYSVLHRKGAVKELPYGTPNNYPAAILLIFTGVFICLLSSISTSAFDSFVEKLFGITLKAPETDKPLTSVLSILMQYISIAVLPALIEEFCVRGVVMQSLRKYGDGFAIGVSAVVFALLHANAVQIPFALIGGLIIGYAVIVTDSIWTGIIIHFLNNAVSVTIKVISDNTSNKLGIALTGLMLFVIMVLGMLSLVIYLVKYKKAFQLKKAESNLLTTGEKSSAFLFNAPMIIAFVLLLMRTAQTIEFK